MQGRSRKIDASCFRLLSSKLQRDFLLRKNDIWDSLRFFKTSKKRERLFFYGLFLQIPVARLAWSRSTLSNWQRLGFRDRYPCSYGQLMFSGYQDPPPKTSIGWNDPCCKFFFFTQANPHKRPFIRPQNSTYIQGPCVVASFRYLI